MATVLKQTERLSPPRMVGAILAGSIELDSDGAMVATGVGAIEVLPEIVDAVGAGMDVVIDSGFMRGTDIVKAIALGAKAVGIGKLYCFGLAAGGPRAVVRMLELLEVEMKWAMGLLGVTALEQLDPSYLRAAVPARPAGLTSAHPHIDIPNPTYLDGA